MFLRIVSIRKTYTYWSTQLILKNPDYWKFNELNKNLFRVSNKKWKFPSTAIYHFDTMIPRDG